MTSLSQNQIEWLESFQLTTEDVSSKQVEWIQENVAEHTESIDETDIIGLYIEYDIHGMFRILDSIRFITGEWAHSSQFATLEMPDDMKSPETGIGFWIFQHDENHGLPANMILEVY